MSVEIFISDKSYEKLLVMSEVSQCRCIGTLVDLIIEKEYLKYQKLIAKKRQQAEGESAAEPQESGTTGRASREHV